MHYSCRRKCAIGGFTARLLCHIGPNEGQSCSIHAVGPRSTPAQTRIDQREAAVISTEPEGHERFWYTPTHEPREQRVLAVPDD